MTHICDINIVRGEILDWKCYKEFKKYFNKSMLICLKCNSVFSLIINLVYDFISAQSHKQRRGEKSAEAGEQVPRHRGNNKALAPSSPGGSCVLLFPYHCVLSPVLVIVCQC